MSSPRSSGSQAESLSVARSCCSQGGGEGAAAAARAGRAKRKALPSEDEEAIQSLLETIPQISQHFDVLAKIGEGTFSSVYLATLKGSPDDGKFAVKHLVPTCSPSRVENELKFLQMLGGRDHVIGIHTCVRHRDHIALIMPFFPHDRFADYLPLMSVPEAQCYMRALFRALRNVHAQHIIHRDIKPSNFLYNRATQQFQLVDFGLAHLEKDYNTRQGVSVRANSRTKNPGPAPCPAPKHKPRKLSGAAVGSNGLLLQAPPPSSYQRSLNHRGGAVHGSTVPLLRRQTLTTRGKGSGREEGGRSGGSTEEIRLCPLRHKVTEVCDFCMSRSQQAAPRAGTPGFRAPEVLLKCPTQTTALDMWSTGVILLCLLSGRYPFFKAHNDLSALAQIISLLGSRECTLAARSYGKELVVVPEVPRVNLPELCSTLRESLPPPSSSSPPPPPPPSSNSSSRSETHHPPLKRARPPDSPEKAPLIQHTPPTHSSKHCLRTSPQVRRSPRKLKSSSSSTVGLSSPPCCCADGISWKNVPHSVYDLLSKCLDLNPKTRMSADQALKHCFITEQLK